MSNTARKARKRNHHGALADLAEAREAGNPERGRFVKALREIAAETAYTHTPKAGTPLLDRPSFYLLPERRQVPLLEVHGIAYGKALLGKLAARRPPVDPSTRLRNFTR